MAYNDRAVGSVRNIKTKYMNEEQIRDEARKAANGSQFSSNYRYDHKSYEDGFYEGMTQALSQLPVVGQSELLPCEMCGGKINQEDKFTDEKHCEKCGWF
jgi:hypothetical protein